MGFAQSLGRSRSCSARFPLWNSLPAKPSWRIDSRSSISRRHPEEMPSNLPLLASPPAEANPWAPLSRAEIHDVKAWLFQSSQNLNLTEALGGCDSDNIASGIESYPPTKDDALAFLDSPDVQTRSTPGRYARVTIDHGGLEAPVTRDYVIGPLPTSGKTKIRQLTEIYHRPDIPFNARGLLDYTTLLETIGKAMAPMAAAIEVRLVVTVKIRFTDGLDRICSGE